MQMRRRLARAWLTWLALFALFAGDRAMAAIRVYIVASYHEGDLCGQPQYEGIRTALAESGLDLDVRTVFLDARHQDPKALQERLPGLRRRILDQGVELVVTIDDPAFAALAPTVLDHPEQRLVFSGLNVSLDTYNRDYRFLDGRVPTKNITGVYEKLFLAEQMRFFTMMLGSLTKVAVLHSTDPVGLAVRRQIQEELAATPFAARLEFMPVHTLDEVLRAAGHLNDRQDISAYIPLVLTVEDSRTGGRKTLPDLAPLLLAEVRKPDLALNKAITRLGFLGGVSVDFQAMGHQAGVLAVKLLQGYPPDRLPVEDALRSSITLNRQRLRQLGIELSDDLLNTVDELF